VTGTATSAAAPRLGLASLPDCFTQTVAEHGDAIALVDGSRRLTYYELDEISDRIASLLARRGIEPGSIVGVSVGAASEAVEAILGVLKAGCAYLPLDPRYPRERREFMCADAGAAMVISDGPPEGNETGEPFPFEALAPAPRTRPRPPISPDDLAYVMFTSGSSGRPKGVCVSHDNVLQLLQATSGLFDFGSDDAWTLFHSYSFDFSVWEMWGAFAYGGRLIVVPDETKTAPGQLLDLLEAESVTVFNQVPSVFRYVADAFAQRPRKLSLRYIVFGGEALDRAAARRWLEAAGTAAPRLVNMYGITETTVHVTYKELAADDLLGEGPTPIGVPLPHLDVLVADDQLRPVAPGAIGEMLVGGAGVAAGYLNRPELTRERFISLGEPPRRFYRTGDRARLGSDGELEYHGRLDDQVKIKGFRIELGEVEAALRRHPDVAAAVTAVVATKRGDPQLIAFYTRSSDARRPGEGTLRHHMVRTLPAHMLPARFVEVAALPLTPSGKVDRRALAAELPPAASSPDERGGQTAGSELADEAVQLTAKAFGDVLGIDDVPLDQPFNALGGTSFLVPQLVRRLEALTGLVVPLARVAANPTVEELAAWVNTNRSSARTKSALRARGPSAASKGGVPLAEAQAGFWIDWQLDPDDRSAHCLLRWSLDEFPDPDALRAALVDVQERHEALRARYLLEDRVPTAIPAPRKSVELRIEADGREEGAAADVETWLLRPFELAEGAVWRAALRRHRPDSGSCELVIAVHHVAFDGWSEAVLARDLSAAFAARASGARPAFAAPAPTLAELAADRAEQTRFADMDALQERASERLVDIEPLHFTTPTSVPRPSVATTVIDVDPDLYCAMRTAALSSGATEFVLWIAAFGEAIAATTGQSEFGILTPVTRRPSARMEAAVACLINTVCLRFRHQPGAADAAIAPLAREVADALSLQDVSFSEAVRALRRRGGHFDPHQVVFGLQATAQPRLRLPGIEARFDRLPRPGAVAPVICEVRPLEDGGAKVWLTRRPELVDAGAAQELGTRLLRAARRLSGGD
jgi:amino acid adenylation domain-containing protein